MIFILLTFYALKIATWLLKTAPDANSLRLSRKLLKLNPKPRNLISAELTGRRTIKLFFKLRNANFFQITASIPNVILFDINLLGQSFKSKNTDLNSICAIIQFHLIQSPFFIVSVKNIDSSTSFSRAVSDTFERCTNNQIFLFVHVQIKSSQWVSKPGLLRDIQSI